MFALAFEEKRAYERDLYSLSSISIWFEEPLSSQDDFEALSPLRERLGELPCSARLQHLRIALASWGSTHSPIFGPGLLASLHPTRKPIPNRTLGKHYRSLSYQMLIAVRSSGKPTFESETLLVRSGSGGARRWTKSSGGFREIRLSGHNGEGLLRRSSSHVNGGNLLSLMPQLSANYQSDLVIYRFLGLGQLFELGAAHTGAGQPAVPSCSRASLSVSSRYRSWA